jgi:hypothetical protein
MSESASIQNYEHVFGPETTAAMAFALDQICIGLRIYNNDAARDIVAIRIIELARRGVRDPSQLRDRVLNEAGGSGLDYL